MPYSGEVRKLLPHVVRPLAGITKESVNGRLWAEPLTMSHLQMPRDSWSMAWTTALAYIACIRTARESKKLLRSPLAESG